MPSRAFDEVRQLRRNRYGQIMSSSGSTNRRLNSLTRRTLYPSSFLDRSGGDSNNNNSNASNSNVPRQRHGRPAGSTERHDESLRNSLMEANQLEMKSLQSIVASSTRRGRRRVGTAGGGGGEFFGRQYTVREGEHEDDDDDENDDDHNHNHDRKTNNNNNNKNDNSKYHKNYDDVDGEEDEDEECGCIPGRDMKSVQKREYWRRRLRDLYIFFFVAMFVAAFMVLLSSREASAKRVRDLTPKLIKSASSVSRSKSKSSTSAATRKGSKVNVNEDEDDDEDDDEESSNDEEQSSSSQRSILKLLDPLLDLTTPYNASTETPLFFDIPLTGASIVKTTMSKCHNLTLASELGLQQPNYAEDALQVFTSSSRMRSRIMGGGFNATYINVDTSSTSGLQRAAALGLVPSRLADVISIDSLFDGTSILFGGDDGLHPGRMFAMFAHPTARAVGYYHYIKKATWDERFHPDVKLMTLRQYASSKYIEDNPLVRLLTQAPGVDPKRKLTRKDLEDAKQIVGKKCLIGLYRDVHGSLARFDRYFGWGLSKIMVDSSSNSTSTTGSGPTSASRERRGEYVRLNQIKQKQIAEVKRCRSNLAQSGDWWMIEMQKYKKLEHDSAEEILIEKSNVLDLKLYEHIELVYEAQGDKIFHVV